MINEDAAIKSMQMLAQSFMLLKNAIRSITETLQKMFPKKDEAFEELGRLALSSRGYRKVIRWEEKNRRRRLKGFPEKPCPYLYS